MYVSDVLADLLPGSGPVREQVRSHCVALVDRLPAEIAGPIRPAAEYIGAKCMGYPPVWLVGRALELAPEELDGLLGRSHTALCVSLSTSIADDFLDREAVGSPHLMFFYLLLFEALAQQDWGREGLGDFIYGKAVSTMDLFVLPGVRQHLRAGCDLEALEHMARRSGLRIGNFHRMTAYNLLHALEEAPPLRDELIDLAGRFGSWCSDFDDVLDVERDILQGEPAALAALAVLRLDPGLRPALVERDLAQLSRCLESPDFVAFLTGHLVRSARDLAQRARAITAPRLARDLADLADQLPAQVAELRRLERLSFAASPAWQEKARARPAGAPSLAAGMALPRAATAG